MVGRGLQKAGLHVIVPCAVVALANAVAFRVFPNEWGGPNIGGGALQALCYLGILVGAILLIVGTVQRRGHRA